LQVLIKLKSTLNGQGPNQMSGCNYDGYGFAVPFLHFVGLLRSDRFSAFVKDLIDTDPGTDSNGSSRTDGEEDEDEEEMREGAKAKRQKLSDDDDTEEGEILPEEELPQHQQQQQAEE
jgi:hypothetical protein